MPFAGLGLHILFALFCAVHVVRSGQQLYWLFILFAFPLLGSLVYFFVIYLPNSRLERGARKTLSAAARSLDPGRAVREARERFDATPTAQHQMDLAAALLDNGQAAEAATQYEACLKGPFASDPDIRLGAARAFADSGRPVEALAHLEALRRERADFRADQIAVLRARCLAALDGHHRDEARAAFEEALSRHGTFEAHAEYAIWALGIGDQATAQRLQAEIERITRHWNKMSRELNEPVLRRLRAARQAS
ncbi:tetratricopeptide repeat protein [Roseateles sp. DAIF2]|uniref:tetratricopeptide repeat protein n=1 Tax=Roseateles sp. DAIF2 TaxID=2714952 RepID=UPI0018A2CD86|nr:tetratricopeptide repeat protein [Roseateles sp. DAIF2]QPF71836.1 tetratricopeptide repeat protein [Roseateles sp. DAIF2]